MSLRQLSAYSSLSRTTLLGYINADPATALPASRPGTKILVRRDDFDGWLRGSRSVGRPQLLSNLRELGLVEAD